MKRVAIIGGETHLYEITRLQGAELAIAGTCMRDEQRKTALPNLAAPNFNTLEALLAAVKPDIVAVSNENDLKARTIMAALRFGCDVIADKPLCLTMAEQQEMETWLADHPRQRLLNLLTLRGDPVWRGLRECIQSGAIGQPAFIHVRMAVQLKRAQRPPWFLDWRRSGGLFLDLLIHGLDQVEWLTGTSVTALTANMGNLGDASDPHLRDHAAVYAELSNGGSAVVEGQRLMPPPRGSDYRAMVAGTGGYADINMTEPALRITNASGADRMVTPLPDQVSVVKDWLAGGELVPQVASLRANRLAILATQSALEHRRIPGK